MFSEQKFLFPADIYVLLMTKWCKVFFLNRHEQKREWKKVCVEDFFLRILVFEFQIWPPAILGYVSSDWDCQREEGILFYFHSGWRCHWPSPIEIYGHTYLSKEIQMICPWTVFRFQQNLLITTKISSLLVPQLLLLLLALRFHLYGYVQVFWISCWRRILERGWQISKVFRCSAAKITILSFCRWIFSYLFSVFSSLSAVSFSRPTWNSKWKKV